MENILNPGFKPLASTLGFTLQPASQAWKSTKNSVSRALTANKSLPYFSVLHFVKDQSDRKMQNRKSQRDLFTQ
jgi:hypothetical protein